jgi:SAM-dependent methyltransferase
VAEELSVLDLGCGTGQPIARFFIEKGCAVTGIDVAARRSFTQASTQRNTARFSTRTASMSATIASKTRHAAGTPFGSPDTGPEARKSRAVPAPWRLRGLPAPW